MKKIPLFLIVGLIISCSRVDGKLTVVERDEAIQFHKGYFILSSDSVFLFKGQRYLIKTREFFDKNQEITSAVIWSEMGYENWPKAEMLKIKYFFKDYNFSESIHAYFVGDSKIKVNNDIALIDSIDLPRKIVYYSLVNDKNKYGQIYKHRLIYK